MAENPATGERLWGRFTSKTALAARCLRGVAELNTFNTHLSHWKRFRAFCLREGHSYLPANTETVALFFDERIEQTPDSNKSVLNSARSAINFVHCKVNALESPCEGFMCRRLLAMIQSERARASVQKLGIPDEVLAQLWELFLEATDTEMILIYGMILIGCYYLCRFSDLCRVDIKFCKKTATQLGIFFQKRKNEKVGTMVWHELTHDRRCISRVWDKLRRTFWYFEEGPLLMKLDHYKLRAVACLHRPSSGQAMGYSTFSRLFRSALMDGGISRRDIKKYCTQSMRRTGASKLAAAGVPDNIIDRCGNWHCKKSKRVYIVPMLAARLAAARALQV